MNAAASMSMRLPGLHVEGRERVMPVRTRELETGVPLFLGFGASDMAPTSTPGRGVCAVVALERWDADAFEASVRPAAGSHLAAAVAGFFVNGGGRCVVMTVPVEPMNGMPHTALLRALGPGGPLEGRDDIDLVCVPDAGCARVDDLDACVAVLAAAVAHCESMGDRFALLDAPPRRLLEGRDAVAAVVGIASSLRSAHAALYHPWIAVAPRSGDRPGEPAVRREWRLRARLEDHLDASGFDMPACGHVAGFVARMDAKIGPQQAPAHQRLEGAVDTVTHLDASQQALLVNAGVNPLRVLRRGGVEVGAARTLSGHSAWAHVSTARVMTGFHRWLATGLLDLAFEPNDRTLRDRMRLRLVSRCMAMRAEGQIVDGDSSPAFFVQCDDELNPASERGLGRIVSHVGLAPSVPAEYIVVRVMHDASGITVGAPS